MILAKVKGNVVSTIKATGYESRKILVVQPIDPHGNATGKTFLAVDAVQAGTGDTVLVIDEGGSARQIIGEPDTYTIRSVVAGIVDEITISNSGQ
ncbi:MAG: EutN/CcmL family microcompartment protein [Bacteroidetes bacterium]|nr:EutN/CcmL family microcompartment protein [Bacteroidota bacterium]